MLMRCGGRWTWARTRRRRLLGKLASTHRRVAFQFHCSFPPAQYTSSSPEPPRRTSPPDYFLSIPVVSISSPRPAT